MILILVLYALTTVDLPKKQFLSLPHIFFINPCCTSQPTADNFKTGLIQYDMFDPHLPAKIIHVVHVSYGGEKGFL